MKKEEENIKLSNLLFPNIKESPEDIIGRYPKRDIKDGQLVLRFAPSPTGFLHLGTVYTSFINRKLSDQTKGICILRIEDTDKKREVEGGVDIIIRGLSDFNIFFEESIDNGNYGPYIQSERLDIYKVFAKDLVSKGLAYPCFATEQELEEIRHNQNEIDVRTGYYGQFAKWRDASFDNITKMLDKGEKFVIRLYSTGDYNQKFEYDDRIKGRCTFVENDMDSVLLKSDGFPTYHLAHPIDDILMGVNLVIRTHEWFPSIPLHLEIFSKLGFNPIPYAHPSPLMKMDQGNRRKLSKRKDPEADAKFFIDEGYPVVGVLEYFLNIMNSNFADWRIQNPDLSYTEFRLRLEKFNKAGALFDMVKLESVCKEYVASLSAQEVYQLILEWAKRFDEDLADRMEKEKNYCIEILNIEREGSKVRKDIVKWKDVYNQFDIFFDDWYERIETEDFPENVPKEDRVEILGRFLGVYDLRDDVDTWFNKIKEIANDLGYSVNYKEYKEEPEKFKGKVGDIAMVLRIALTKRTKSPDLYQVMKVLGKERIEYRLRAFMI